MRFKPLPVLTLLAIPSLVVLVFLGHWQMQRMAWKRGLIAQIEAGIAAPAIPVADALAAAARGEDVAYRKVIVEPVAGSPAMVEWSSPRRVFRFGSFGAGLILVETARGDAPSGAQADQPDKPVEALLRPAGRPNQFTPDNDPVSGFWYWLDAPAMARTVADPAWRTENGGKPVEANWYAAARTLCDYALPVGDRPCSPVPNPRADPTADTLSPERHLGYMITWWGLAVALIAIYFAIHARAGRFSFR